ncbi:HAMP domain-containing protein [Bacillus sp. ISL-51]|uniref:methyl-accepting chemotaxis protein n=1 Tax=Bacteria TaxID=2 RepID=UPI001BEB875E|nr:MULTISPECIES: methyl-accepting chemotaxis protein [Bacteria]MBT2573584.1 HAMP domain-containing protein [Bacillus sp. ISL-51]MBT2633848.1 HAMP domain-containing protein [Bacillus sp. ISL-26]MBT2712563.1 HAMP domain-containing protein [Pseudomonas sp. ISL-88]
MFKKMHLKIAVFVSAMLILTVVFLTVSSYLTLKPMMTDEAKHTTQNVTNSLGQNIELQLKNYEISLLRLANGELSRSFLTEGKKDTAQLFHDELKQIEENDKYVALAYVGTERKQMITYPKADFAKDYDPTNRSWYKLAAEKPDRVVWTEPYKDVVTGDMIVTAAKAVQNGGKVIGVASLDLKLSSIQSMVNKQKVPYKGFAFLADENGALLAHPSEQGKNISDDQALKVISSGKEGIQEQQGKMIVYQTIKETGWKVGTQFDKDQLMGVADRMNTVSIFMSLIALVITIGLSYFLAKTITGPIQQLIAKTNSVSAGDLTVHAQTKSRDEIGVLTKDFNQMVENMKSMVEQVKTSSEQVSDTSEQLTVISQETNETSGQIAKAIEEVAAGATEQASEVETINEKSENLSSKMKGIADRAGSIKTLSKSSEDASYKGLDALGQLLMKSNEANSETKKVEVMLTDLENQTKNIEEVVTAISAISDQTNLLALNASIEAARAGESGRGFAVVAEEVRKLAEQSALSSKHISETVRLIQSETKEASHAMTEASRMNDEQNSAIHETGEVLNLITTEMQSLVQGIDHIYHDIQKMSEEQAAISEAIQSISAISQESAAAAEEVNASTDEQLVTLEKVKQSTDLLKSASEELIGAISKFTL